MKLPNIKKVSETIGKRLKDGNLKKVNKSKKEVKKQERVKFSGSTLKAKNSFMYVEYKEDVMYIHEGVSQIAPCAFMGNETIQRIVFPASLRKIGYGAFQRCFNLTEICFQGNNNLITIGDYAFAETNLEKVELRKVKLGASVFANSQIKECYIEETDSIPNGAFKNTPLEKLKCSDEVKRIGSEAFYATALEMIKIPKQLEEIGERAFCNCESLFRLKEFEFCKVQNISEGCFDNCRELSSINLPETVEVIEKKAFHNCENLKKLNLMRVKFIGDSSFSNSGIMDAVLMDIEEIPQRAFFGCKSLKTLSFTDEVKRIGKEAFANTALEKVSLAKVESIDASAFRCCLRLQAVYIGTKLEYLGKSVFKECIELMEIKIDSMYLDIIPESMCEDCVELTAVYFARPEKIETIGNRAFKNCIILEAIGNCYLREIEYQAFYNCLNLKSFDLGNRLKVIGKQSFSKTGIKEINIPETIEIIDTAAFSTCLQLEIVKFEKNIVNTEMYENIFKDSNNLKRIILPKEDL